MSSQNYAECPNCQRKNKHNATYCSRCGVSMEGEVDPLIGKYVGKYIMQKRIGAGGSGTVYLGVHADLGRQVAVKVLRSNLITDEESKARFEREARVLAGLVHENIVTIIDIGYLPGIGPFMVMEWLEGFTLFEARRQRKHLEFHEILPLFDQLSSSISYMHKQGVIHRDLKPENMILVARGGETGIEHLSTRVMKLYDFGIALFTAGDERKLTAAGLVVGTPHYMAPEQIIINAPVTHRADLYAIGCILFELIVGHPPFWGAKRPVDIMGRHINEAPKPLIEPLPNRDIPYGLQAVMDRALAKKPAERFHDGREFFEALKAALVTPAPIPIHETQPFSLDDVDDKTIVQSSDIWNISNIQSILNDPNPFDNRTIADPHPAPPRPSPLPSPLPSPISTHAPVSPPTGDNGELWPPPISNRLNIPEDLPTRQETEAMPSFIRQWRWPILFLLVTIIFSSVAYFLFRQL